MKHLKSQESYEIFISKKNIPYFETSKGLVYTLFSNPGNVTAPGFSFSSQVTYVSFNCINRPPKQKRHWDPFIMNTVINFFIDILSVDPNAIIIYLYSPGEDQALQRERLFNKYVAKFLEQIEQRHIEHKTDKGTLLFKRDNKFREELLSLTGEEIVKKIDAK